MTEFFTDRFREALEVTFRYEGGWADDADDPGGRTMMGITEATWKLWQPVLGLEAKDVSQVTHEDASLIYWHGYWLEGGCDHIPWPVALVHFDSCVNLGTRRSIKFLQGVVGVAADGVMGPVTGEAVRLAPPAALIDDMLARRRQLHLSKAMKHRERRKFLLAWMTRCENLRAQAIKRLPTRLP